MGGWADGWKGEGWMGGWVKGGWVDGFVDGWLVEIELTHHLSMQISHVPTTCRVDVGILERQPSPTH